MSIDDPLSKFYSGELSFAELEAAVRAVAANPKQSARLLELLQAGFSSGRLPPQLFHQLRSHLTAADSGAAKTILPSRPVDQTQDPGAAESTDTRTRIESMAGGGAAVTFVPDKVLPPEATLVTGQAARPDTTETISPRFPKSGNEVGSDAPQSTSRSTYATGSNWARPEQWTERQAGPIGPGSVIKGRFQIEEQLGKGGMGIVFKARDRLGDEANDADPYVAIKILSDEFRHHPQALVALQRESRKAQTLAHPNIVAVHNFDRDGTTVYMTMELLRGQSLSEYIRNFRTGATITEAGPIIQEMSEGLAYAHKRNIVHSDFKPGNVFLTDDGRVKILDFGIARAVQQPGVAPDSARDFDAGELGALTPGYASLEMFNGSPPDPADDVYALAVTAYQLLTGNHPYDHLTAEEAIVARKAPRPIKRISRRQWKTIAKGLELRREDRIPNAAQFLRRFRGPTRFAKYASAAIVVLALSSGYFAWQSLQAPGPDVPFDQLPVAVQIDFNNKVGEADSIPAGGENYAIELYVDAWDLHPRNPIIMKKLDEAAQAYSAAVRRHLESLSNDMTKVELASEDAIKNLGEWQKNEHLATNQDLDELRAYLNQFASSSVQE